MPFRFGPQLERSGGEVVRVVHRLGKEPISARYFIERCHQQGVVGEIDADGERAFHAIDHHVEVVVGAERDLPRRPAFGRIGVDVVELLEAGWIFQVAERRHAVPPRCPPGQRASRPAG